MNAPEDRGLLDGGVHKSAESKPSVAQIVEAIRRPGDFSPSHQEWRAVKAHLKIVLRQGPSRIVAAVRDPT